MKKNNKMNKLLQLKKNKLKTLQEQNRVIKNLKKDKEEKDEKIQNKNIEYVGGKAPNSIILRYIKKTGLWSSKPRLKIIIIINIFLIFEYFNY